MTEGRKAGRASKLRPGPLLISKCGSATESKRFFFLLSLFIFKLLKLFVLCFSVLPASPNTTTVYTKHDDIAHFTCTTRAPATITWKRGRTNLENSDLGVEMLSMTENDHTSKSHLFIAITDDDLRGKYTCTSSDEPDVTLQTFIIESKTVNHLFLV